MDRKSLLSIVSSIVIVLLGPLNVRAQCHYIPSTSTSTDTLSYLFSGGSFASYGCAPIDPSYWLSGSGNTVTINFVHPQTYPAIRVWGMNDDDAASININGTNYPLTSSSAGYDPKVVCGQSPGPYGVGFSGGMLVGINSNSLGNYSYQDVQFYTDNVTSIKITGMSGAGWGFAGVLVDCPLLSVHSEALTVTNLIPNPTTGKIIIQGSKLENAEITIINELGKCMRKMKNSNNTIDISDFPQGIYSLLIELDNQMTVKRIIKI